MCRLCNDPKGVLKPDVVFFGEDLPEEFHEKMGEDVKKVSYFANVFFFFLQFTNSSRAAVLRTEQWCSEMLILELF